MSKGNGVCCVLRIVFNALFHCRTNMKYKDVQNWYFHPLARHVYRSRQQISWVPMKILSSICPMMRYDVVMHISFPFAGTREQSSKEANESRSMVGCANKSETKDRRHTESRTTPSRVCCHIHYSSCCCCSSSAC